MVDFVFIIRYIVATATTFAVIFVMSPIIYNIWHLNLRNTIPNTAYGLQLMTVGDTFFENFRILAFIVPGLIIVWGFVVAQRKRVQETTI